MRVGDRRSSIAAVVGVVALVALGITSWLAVAAGLDARSYAGAPECAAVTGGADCRRVVPGTVLGVTEYGGKAATWRLEVATDSGAVRVGFPSDNDVLADASDGVPVMLTYWHGSVVSVSGAGGSSDTDAAPGDRLASMVGGALLSCGIADYALLLAALPTLVRRYGQGGVVGRDAAGPHATARTFLYLLAAIGGTVPLLTGVFQLELGPQDAAGCLWVGGVAFLGVIGLAGWTTHRTRRGPRRAGRRPVRREGRRTERRTDKPAPGRLRLCLGLPVLRRGRDRRVLPNLPLPAIERSKWGEGALTILSGLGLAALVLAATQTTSAQAYRAAPTCGAQAITADCRAVVPMAVNGLRSPVGSGLPDVSMATADGTLNTWAEFEEGPLTREAAGLKSAGTYLPVHIWQGRIIGVDVDGGTDWAVNAPPDPTFALTALSVLLGLCVIVNRVRARLRNRSRATSTRRMLLEDLGPCAVAALGVWLLGLGFVWAVAPVLAAPIWSLVAVRTTWRAERSGGYVPVLPGHTEREPVLFRAGTAGLRDSIVELADAPLLLEPRDPQVERIVNRALIGAERLDDPASDELPALVEGLVAALRERITLARREGPALFYAFVDPDAPALYLGVGSFSRAEALRGPVPPEVVDSLAELLATWRDLVAEARVRAEREDAEEDQDELPGEPLVVWFAELV